MRIAKIRRTAQTIGMMILRGLMVVVYVVVVVPELGSVTVMLPESDWASGLGDMIVRWSAFWKGVAQGSIRSGDDNKDYEVTDEGS